MAGPLRQIEAPKREAGQTNQITSLLPTFDILLVKADGQRTQIRSQNEYDLSVSSSTGGDYLLFSNKTDFSSFIIPASSNVFYFSEQKQQLKPRTASSDEWQYGIEWKEADLFFTEFNWATTYDTTGQSTYEYHFSNAQDLETVPAKRNAQNVDLTGYEFKRFECDFSRAQELFEGTNGRVDIRNLQDASYYIIKQYYIENAPEPSGGAFAEFLEDLLPRLDRTERRVRMVWWSTNGSEEDRNLSPTKWVFLSGDIYDHQDRCLLSSDWCVNGWLDKYTDPYTEENLGPLASGGFGFKTTLIPSRRGTAHFDLMNLDGDRIQSFVLRRDEHHVYEGPSSNLTVQVISVEGGENQNEWGVELQAKDDYPQSSLRVGENFNSRDFRITLSDVIVSNERVFAVFDIFDERGFIMQTTIPEGSRYSYSSMNIRVLDAVPADNQEDRSAEISVSDIYPNATLRRREDFHTKDFHLNLSNIAFPIVDNGLFETDSKTIWSGGINIHRGGHTFSKTNPMFLGYEKVGENAAPTLPKIIYNPNFSISAFPNPTNAFATIRSNSQKPGTLSITDILGKRVYSEQVSPGEVKVSLDLRDLPPGNYFATLEEEGKPKASTKITLVK